jgi:short-subunit dehydrogenase
MNGKSERHNAFRERYGAWALVAGASEGIGRAFSESLAKRGLHVVLVARKQEPLVHLAEELNHAYHIETLPLALDLSASSSVNHIADATEAA